MLRLDCKQSKKLKKRGWKLVCIRERVNFFEKLKIFQNVWILSIFFPKYARNARRPLKTHWISQLLNKHNFLAIFSSFWAEPTFYPQSLPNYGPWCFIFPIHGSFIYQSSNHLMIKNSCHMIFLLYATSGIIYVYFRKSDALAISCILLSLELFSCSCYILCGISSYGRWIRTSDGILWCSRYIDVSFPSLKRSKTTHAFQHVHF